MTIDPKQRLMELGTELLAEALLELAAHGGVAEDLVERMIATPQENTQRFKGDQAQPPLGVTNDLETGGREGFLGLPEIPAL